MPSGNLSVQRTSKASGFLGTWLVLESIYGSDGTHFGYVKQRRALTQLSDTRIRVLQSCSPQPSLAYHPMFDFNGEWIFELEMNGQDRHYLGPDVIGGGRVFGDSIILGRGLWPRFGHSFRSFAVLGTNTRQLTGGSFSRATKPTAHIMGVAVAEDEATDWPVFEGPWWPGMYRETWSGNRTTTDPAGKPLSTQALTRHYPKTDDGGWLGYTEISDTTERHAQFNFVTGQTGLIEHDGEATCERQGFSVRYGHMWNSEVVGDDHTITTGRHIIDTSSNTVVDIQSVYQHDTLIRVDITKLSPTSERTLLEH